MSDDHPVPRDDVSPDSPAVNEAVRRARWRVPAAVITLAGLAHGGLWWWADGDLSLLGGLAVVIWLLASLVMLTWFLFLSGTSRRVRLLTAATLGVAAIAFGLLFRWNGQAGNFVPRFEFRFAPTAEQRALEYFDSDDSASIMLDLDRLEVTADDWPRFGGSDGAQIVRGASIRRDWEQHPPIALWRHPIGPAWSSFAVVGDLAFTQEQRGDEEAVVCYHVESGRQVWIHTDPVRFEEAASGSGPRATPTINDSRLYALGATGILNCLDPLSGDVIWSVDVVEDAETDLIMYGMSGSPLVYEDAVIVYPSGDGGAIAAYDRVTGEPKWSGGSYKQIYASPKFATIDGMPQTLVYSEQGISGHELGTARRLWLYEWTNVTGLNLAQPIVLPDESIFISSGYATGSARLKAFKQGDSWAVEPIWVQPNRFKLKFNGGIYDDGFLYGLDEGILSCIDAEDGERMWKQGRYRYGQIIKVGGDLLIVAEDGEVALVEISPQGANEVASFQAIEGKTWNHPVLHRGRLLVRNAEEAACYDLRPK